MDAQKYLGMIALGKPMTSIDTDKHYLINYITNSIFISNINLSLINKINKKVNKWARGDLNPGPPPRQGGVLPD